MAAVREKVHAQRWAFLLSARSAQNTSVQTMSSGLPLFPLHPATPPPLLHRAPFVLAIKKERQRRKVAKRKGGEAQRRGERNHRRKTMLLFGRNEEQGTPLSGKKAKKHTQTTHSERKEASRQKGKAAHTHTARIQIVYGNGTQRRARGITSLLTAPRTPQE